LSLKFWTPISVHPDGKHLWYFKLGLFHLTKSIVWGLRSTTLGFKVLAIRKSEFVAKTQFHLVSSLVNLKLDWIIWKRNIKTAISIFPYHKIYWREKSIISKLFYLLFIQIFISKYILYRVSKKKPLNNTYFDFFNCDIVKYLLKISASICPFLGL